jgi:hypothetical protein
MKKDLATGTPIPLMDFRKVLEYGEPVVCLPPGRVAFSPGPMVDTLREKLKDFTDNDYIVSVGDPTAIFVAAMIASDINRGKVKALKWDKISRRYIAVDIDIHYRTRKESV